MVMAVVFQLIKQTVGGGGGCGLPLFLSFSSWCSLFEDEDDMAIVEYRNDLNSYWKKGGNDTGRV